MNYSTLIFEVRDSVGWLTLNRPDKGNALNYEMVSELRKLFTGLADNLDCHLIVIRGAGKHFCSGADLSSGKVDMSKGNAATNFDCRGYKISEDIFDIPIKMRQIPQPLIAVLHGGVIGGGFAMASACDMRLAGSSTQLSSGATRVGVSGGDMGTSYFLPRLIGMSRAAEYIYTSRFFDAATAAAIGFVSRAVPDEELEAATESLVREFLNISPFALRMTKKTLNAGVDASLETVLMLESQAHVLCGMTEDKIESVRANVLEKRVPKYKFR